jgi:hypothetical protein
MSRLAGSSRARAPPSPRSTRGALGGQVEAAAAADPAAVAAAGRHFAWQARSRALLADTL